MPPCPICGKPLTAVTGPADWAPWLCSDDARGFWPAEIERAEHFRPITRDFPPALHDEVEAAIAADVEAQS